MVCHGKVRLGLTGGPGQTQHPGIRVGLSREGQGCGVYSTAAPVTVLAGPMRVQSRDLSSQLGKWKLCALVEVHRSFGESGRCLPQVEAVLEKELLADLLPRCVHKSATGPGGTFHLNCCFPTVIEMLSMDRAIQGPALPQFGFTMRTQEHRLCTGYLPSLHSLSSQCRPTMVKVLAMCEAIRGSTLVPNPLSRCIYKCAMVRGKLLIELSSAGYLSPRPIHSHLSVSPLKSRPPASSIARSSRVPPIHPRQAQKVKRLPHSKHSKGAQKAPQSCPSPSSLSSSSSPLWARQYPTDAI